MTVVVGLDGSDSSRSAANWGAEWAAAHSESLVLVHVIESGWSAAFSITRDEVVSAARQMLQSVVTQLQEQWPSLVIEHELLEGHTAEELGRRSESATLLVIGTHKLGLVEGMLFGARSLQIVQAAACPVAVIPMGSGGTGHGVVVGVDGSQASEAAIDFAAAEAARLDQPLDAVHAWHIPPTWTIEYQPDAETLSSVEADETRLLMDSLERVRSRYPNLKMTTAVARDYPARVLTKHGKDARLLVVGNRGRTGVKRLFLGSVSHEVLVNIPCPVVVVRSAES